MKGSLAERVQAFTSRVDRETGEARAIAAAGIAVREQVAVLEQRIELHDQVCKLLTSMGEERQQRAQEQIEQLVTRGLQVIFDEDLSFHLIQDVKANQAVVDFVVRSHYGGQVVDTPVMDARGGGLAACVGFMLRLVVLLLTPGARRLLFLDETFAHVSEEYEPRLAEFLREVCDRAGMQIFLVTHSRAYDDVADVRARFELVDGTTEVRKL